MAEGRKPSNLRAVRVPDDLWRAAQQRAHEQGTSVSAVLNDALREFTAEPTAEPVPA